MYREDPYYSYLQAEVRRARHARDNALGQIILEGAQRIAEAVRDVFRAILRLEMRRDDAWVEAMETKLRRHQPY